MAAGSTDGCSSWFDSRPDSGAPHSGTLATATAAPVYVGGDPQ
jgi:hypothetical protein